MTFTEVWLCLTKHVRGSYARVMAGQEEERTLSGLYSHWLECQRSKGKKRCGIFWDQVDSEKVVVPKSLTGSPFKGVDHRVRESNIERLCDVQPGPKIPLQRTVQYGRSLDAPKNFHVCSMKQSILNEWSLRGHRCWSVTGIYVAEPNRGKIATERTLLLN